jgi:putative ABC transport system permease protein
VLLRKALVVFQFAITIVLLIQIFTVNEQLDYMRNMDLGVHTDHTIVINAPTQNTARKNYSVFKQSLLANPNIESVSVSMTVPGEMANEMSTTTGINLSEKITDHHYNFYITDIDADFIPLMGMELLAGNNFNKKSHIDKKDLIVNEEAIRLWGIPEAEKAIGRKLSFWGSEWTIIGVLKNYHQESAKSPYVPMLHMYSTYFGSLASIKFNNDDPKKQVAQIKEIYNSVFPSATFTYFFMDDAFNNQFKAEQRFQSVFGVLTGFSILIACLGLFGLASFTVSKRKKEIGVRKVLGASSMKIVILLTYNFVKTVFISVMISVPITYLLVQRWLENFAFRIELNWWLFLIPILSVFVLVILSVSIKTIHSALANPVESLRSD